MKIKKILLTTFLIPIMWANSLQSATLAEVRQQAACDISGSIYGVSSQLRNDFMVVIFNPNNGQALGRFPGTSYSPGQINYSIPLSKNGIYLLRVFRDKSGYLFPVSTSPSQRLVRCSGGSQITNVDFALQ
jgi:hypothetical protein